MATVRIGHSPDADDAFMFYALTAGKVKIPGVTVEHVLEDIESLNRRARTAELEVTAVSFATYLLIADQYRMMDPGASMGLGYGPILVAREPIPRSELENHVVASPGKHTTSALLLRLYVGDAPRTRDRQGNLPPVRPHVRERLHAGARPRRARRDRAPVRDGPRPGPDPRDPRNRPDLIRWGAPKWPPIPSRARTRPGRAVARLDLAMRFWGGPGGAPHPPPLRFIKIFRAGVFGAATVRKRRRRGGRGGGGGRGARHRNTQ